jgi:hypothetical protein
MFGAATAIHPFAKVRPMDRRTQWIRRPGVDAIMAFCWVPFAVAAWTVRTDPDPFSTLLAATFALSLAHQPLTVALVYGDPGQFNQRRRLFTISPLLFLAAILIGMHVSVILVAAVAGLWNALHTLMQRYGITRIYGRMAGQSDGRIERALLLTWLALAALWAAASPGLPDRIAGIRVGSLNRQGLDLLTSIRPYAAALVVVAVIATVALAVAWWRQERRSAVVNPAKYLYLTSTALLFGVALVDPIVGFLAYVGSHAVEYLVIVHGHLGRRYRGDGADAGGTLGAVVRSPVGRSGFMTAYLLVAVGTFAVLKANSSTFTYTVVFLTFGGLHVFYDGFIWKLRRPAVARAFAIDTARPVDVASPLPVGAVVAPAPVPVTVASGG